MDDVRQGGNPSDRLWELQQSPPAADASVRVWVAWLERQVPWWDAFAAAEPAWACNAIWMADYLRCKVTELRERFQPDDRWPGASSW